MMSWDETANGINVSINFFFTAPVLVICPLTILIFTTSQAAVLGAVFYVDLIRRAVKTMNIEEIGLNSVYAC